MSIFERDWTCDEFGVSNSSHEYLRLRDEIERLIRSDAHALIMGRADMTAGLILAQLAHKHNVGPLG